MARARGDVARSNRHDSEVDLGTPSRHTPQSTRGSSAYATRYSCSGLFRNREHAGDSNPWRRNRGGVAGQSAGVETSCRLSSANFDYSNVCAAFRSANHPKRRHRNETAMKPSNQKDPQGQCRQPLEAGTPRRAAVQRRAFGSTSLGARGAEAPALHRGVRNHPSLDSLESEVGSRCKSGRRANVEARGGAYLPGVTW